MHLLQKLFRALFLLLIHDLAPCLVRKERPSYGTLIYALAQLQQQWEEAAPDLAEDTRRKPS